MGGQIRRRIGYGVFVWDRHIFSSGQVAQPTSIMYIELSNLFYFSLPRRTTAAKVKIVWARICNGLLVLDIASNILDNGEDLASVDASNNDNCLLYLAPFFEGSRRGQHGKRQIKVCRGVLILG